nr:unnamed protein product [Digitaria exilis]
MATSPRSPPPAPAQEFEISRQSRIFAALSKKVIDLDELRMLAAQGVPDAAGVRSTVWKLLLGYLPYDRSRWEQELAKKRSQYAAFKDEFLSNPYSEIMEQIDRDVKRTHPDMHFFCGDSSFAKSNQNFAEADSFFCFVELLSGFRDNFCQKLDNSASGIREACSRQVNPQFYAFRWITLLLTQEFNFADTIHIWDTLLSDPDGPQETLLRICCAMLILVRKRLLAGDFTSNLKLLQNYPPTDIRHLLYVANKLH